MHITIATIIEGKEHIVDDFNTHVEGAKFVLDWHASRLSNDDDMSLIIRIEPNKESANDYFDIDLVRASLEENA